MQLCNTVRERCCCLRATVTVKPVFTIIYDLHQTIKGDYENDWMQPGSKQGQNSCAAVFPLKIMFHLCFLKVLREES